MTEETNGAGPDLIVLGMDEAGKPKAARFPSGHDSVVAKAAKAMNLAVCKADGEVLAELAKKLPPGRLYSTGRGFVPPVGRSLYDKLVEQLKLAGQPVPDETDQPNGDRSAAASRPRLAAHLGQHCRRPHGDRPGSSGGGLVGSYRARPGWRHADPEMA